MKLANSTQDMICALLQEGNTQRDIAASLGLSQSTVSKYANEFALADPTETVEYDGDKAKYAGQTDTEIKTDKDLMRHSGMDPLVWRVKKWGCGAWQTPVKAENLKTDEKGKIWKIKSPQKIQCWKIWAEFERILPKPYEDAVRLLFDSKTAPRPHTTKAIRVSRGDPVAFMVGLFDVHFGKLGWGAETGSDNCDLKSTSAVYENGVHDLFARVAHIKPEIIYWPIGNDFVHIDTAKLETSGGTVVTTDGRQSKIIKTAWDAQIRAIEYASQIAPVKCFYLPGNHDMSASFYLTLAVQAHFRGSKRITVDDSPRSRKYYQYGDTLLGFTHGDKLPAKNPLKLGALMTDENRELTGKTKYGEWFLGHKHASETLQNTGVVVHTIGSLSGMDSYHHDHGYRSRRVAEIYVYEKTGGYCGHWTANARS